MSFQGSSLFPVWVVLGKISNCMYKKEENELADMPVSPDPVWLSSGCRRHGQERPLARGGWDVWVPFDGFSSSADITKHQIIKGLQVFLTRPVLFPKSH